MGIDRETEFAQMGIGLLYPEQNSAEFWGLFLPRLIGTSYRGMKILELLQEVHFGDICACWYAGKRKPHKTEMRYVKKIVRRIGRRRRREILRLTPPDLQDVIERLEGKDIDFETWDL